LVDFVEHGNGIELVVTSVHLFESVSIDLFPKGTGEVVVASSSSDVKLVSSGEGIELALFANRDLDPLEVIAIIQSGGSSLDSSNIISGDFILDHNLVVLNESHLTGLTASDRGDFSISNRVIEHPFLSFLVGISNSHSVVELVVSASHPNLSVGTDSDFIGNTIHFGGGSVSRLSFPRSTVVVLGSDSFSVVDSTVGSEGPNVTISSNTELNHVLVSGQSLLPELVFVFIYIFSGFANGFEPKLMSVINTP
jgi:hypothetical protein